MIGQFLQAVPVAGQTNSGRQSLRDRMLYDRLKYCTSDKRPSNLVNCVQRKILPQEDTGIWNYF